MADDRNVQDEQNKGKETQAYRDLPPPYPTAAGTSLHATSRYAPVRDENEPDCGDQPAVDCHSGETRMNSTLRFGATQTIAASSEV